MREKFVGGDRKESNNCYAKCFTQDEHFNSFLLQTESFVRFYLQPTGAHKIPPN